MFYFPDSDTGYYDDERSFFNHDAEMEARERDREDRFEAQAEEMHETLWAGPIVPYVDDSPIMLPPWSVMRSINATANDVDPETGCTATEMKEEEVTSVLPIESSPQLNNSKRRVA